MFTLWPERPETDIRFAVHPCECPYAYPRECELEKINLPGLWGNSYDDQTMGALFEINAQFMQDRYGIKADEYREWFRRRRSQGNVYTV